MIGLSSPKRSRWWLFWSIALAMLLVEISLPTSYAMASQQRQSDIPIIVSIDSLSYDPNQNQYNMAISINWPREVQRLRFLIQEGEGGKDIDEFGVTVNNLATLQVPFSGDRLTPNRDYQIIVQGENFQGEAIEKPDENGMDSIAERITLAQRAFKHEPPKVTGIPVKISTVNPDWNRGQLVIQLDLDREEYERLDRIQGFIKHKESSAQIDSFGPLIFQGILPIQLDIPPAIRSATEKQSYQLFLTLTTRDNFESTNETPFEFSPELAPQPSRWQRLASALSTPWLIFCVIAVLVATIFWITIQNRQETGPETVAPVPDQTGPYQAYSPSASNRPPVRIHIWLVNTRDRNQFIDETMSEFPIFIGREGCTINISGDPLISRRHLRVDRHGTQVAIVDLESSNGSSVNNAQLVPNKPFLVPHTAEVTLGRHTVIRIEII